MTDQGARGVQGPQDTNGGPAEGATLRSTLHQRGMRMTPQRQLVLDSVRALGHATPEQVCKQIQSTTPTVNITTVYRALDLLEELGLVRHTHLGHGAPTYSVEEHEHVHLVCHHCGTIDEVPCELLDGLATELDEHRGFALDATHLALSGTCRQCRAHPHVAGSSADAAKERS